MAEIRKRQIAYKLRIGDLFKGKPVLDENRLNFLELGERKIVRVNIIGNVVDKFNSEGEKKFASVTLDDASGQVRIRVFGDDIKKFENVNIGNTILIIGNLRYFNNELYILPEIVKQTEPGYLLVRKLELEKDKKEVPEKKEEVIAVKDQIIEMIKNAEGDGGADKEKLIMDVKASPELINQEVQKLLEEGVAYEPRPGKIRFLG